MTDDRAKELTNTELFMRGIQRETAEARENVEKFFEFVIREENTRARLKVAAHQRLHFSFIDWHRRSVTRLPVGTAKTYDVATYLLWRIGKDNTERSAIISNTQNQARKPLTMVANYIAEPELAKRLALVFPHLQRTGRPSEKWTQTEIVVDRPAGIRDATAIAAGISTKVLGSRFSLMAIDDMVSADNSRTPEAREEVGSTFDGTFMSRLDPVHGKVLITNTPWNKEDQTYYLENHGWPTITMDIYGYVRVSNADAAWMKHALEHYIRPSETRDEGTHQWYRLKEHDPDPEEEIPLWPEKYSIEVIEDIRRGMLPHEFARSCLCEPMSEEAGRCKREWIERCKFPGIGKTLVSRYHGANPTFTGMDLGIGKGRRHDKTASVTIEKHPNGKKQLLDIQTTRLKGPEIVDLVLEKYRDYRSVIRVEGNQAQKWIEDFAKEKKKHVPVTAIATTKANKHHEEFGIESIFLEFREGQWIIPCDEDGRCSKEVQGLIDDMMYYDPAAHTPDRLIALWLAREASRRRHGTDPKPRAGLRRLMPSAAGF